MDIKKILTPVDFSPCSSEALRKSIQLASAFGATIDVLNVWEPPLYISGDVIVPMRSGELVPLHDIAMSDASQWLEDLVGRHSPPENVELRPRMEIGRLHSRVLALAVEEQFDLIVMGTHGRKGIAHFLLGSVVEKVIREAPCPVLTVRSTEDD